MNPAIKKVAVTFITPLNASDLRILLAAAKKAPPPAPLGVAALKHAATTPSGAPRKLVPVDVPNEPPPHTDADAPPIEDAQVVASGPVPTAHGDRQHDGDLTFGFGRSKGIAVAAMDENSLRFYLQAEERALADPAKDRFHDKARKNIATLKSELSFRGLL